MAEAHRAQPNGGNFERSEVPGLHRWASHDVQFHRSGQKRLRHAVVGQLDLNYESMELPGEPGLALNVYTAPPDSPTADALKMLASWAATHDLVQQEHPRAENET